MKICLKLKTHNNKYYAQLSFSEDTTQGVILIKSLKTLT